MKKIILIDSSPRKSGNCDAASEHIKAALPDADVEIFKIREKQVNPCRACQFCKKQDHPCCIQKDDISALIPRLAECDAFALLSPIYFGQVNAPAKMFIDRCYPFFNPERPNFSMMDKFDKKAAVIGFCGAGPADVYSKYLSDTARNFQIIGVAATRTFLCGNVNEPGSCLHSSDFVAKLDDIAHWLIAD